MNIYQNKIKQEIRKIAKTFSWTYKEAKEIYKWRERNDNIEFEM